MNSLVPSSGSTTHTRVFARRSAESRVSSESQPSSGNAALMAVWNALVGLEVGFGDRAVVRLLAHRVVALVPAAHDGAGGARGAAMRHRKLARRRAAASAVTACAAALR